MAAAERGAVLHTSDWNLSSFISRRGRRGSVAAILIVGNHSGIRLLHASYTRIIKLLHATHASHTRLIRPQLGSGGPQFLFSPLLSTSL